MRILHILNYVSDKGNGIINTAVDLAIEQARQGQTVAIASAGGGYENFLEGGGVRHLLMPEQPHSPLQVLQSALALRKIIIDFKPNVVHAHVRTGVMLAWPWSKVFHFALVAHVHNVHERESVIMGLASRVIAVSQSVARTIEAQGVAKKKIRTVLNRTLGSLRQPALWEIAGARLVHPAIVTVGGMSHRKGIAELIAAFEIAGNIYPNAHLYLVGEGPERALFEKQASDSAVGRRIHFEGFQSVPQSYMLSADIFVLASRRESFGNVLIEAREAGCAIVASDVDGIAEALDGGRAGMLVPPQDAASLAEALCRLLASADERTALRQAGIAGIEAFTIGSLEAEIQAIYRELVDDGRRCEKRNHVPGGGRKMRTLADGRVARIHRPR